MSKDEAFKFRALQTMFSLTECKEPIFIDKKKGQLSNKVLSESDRNKLNEIYEKLKKTAIDKSCVIITATQKRRKIYVR